MMPSLTKMYLNLTYFYINTNTLTWSMECCSMFKMFSMLKILGGKSICFPPQPKQPSTQPSVEASECRAEKDWAQ